MPSSVIVAAKQGLVALLEAHGLLSAVQVSYGWPGDDQAADEIIFTADARTVEHEPSGLRAGRTYYHEKAQFDVIVQVVGYGSTAEEVEIRCLALAHIVAQVVADNRTLGGVSGVQAAKGTGWVLANRYNDRGTLAELRYTVEYDARLT